MSLGFAHGVLIVLAIYLGLGVIVAVPLVVSGIGRIDPAAKKAPWTFRILVLPGAIAMWPFLLRRLTKAGASS
jgi:hypothetical protein